MTVLLVALGGAAGALVRWALGRLDGGWPAGTLAANAVGCLLAGVVLGATADPAWRALLVTGAAGGCTTFSTWVVQAVELPPARAAAAVAATLLLGLLGVVAGLALGG